MNGAFFPCLRGLGVTALKWNVLSVASAALIGANAVGRPVSPPPSPPPPTHFVLPEGATMIGQSTFATIRVAPPSPTGDVVSQRPTYRSQDEWYAQEAGVTIAEALKRNAEQAALRPAVERLRVRLASAEPDNYVDVKMIHRPDWGYIFYFKRDPAATLAKYSVNPRFRAAQAAFTHAELNSIVAPWAKRFGEAGILNGYGINAIESRVELSMGVTAAEYRALAKPKGWGEIPAPIMLSFAGDLPFARIDPRIAGLLRGFASESRATMMQMEAGFEGQVVLIDGCLRRKTKDGSKGPLAVFHQETGIGLDAQGYLAAIDRRTGKASGRIGEMWSWAGPNPGMRFDGLDALKAACGDGPIVNVGNPESRARFKARYARVN